MKPISSSLFKKTESRPEGEKERNGGDITLQRQPAQSARRPHRWPQPTSKISLKDFKILLHRRARALSHLRSSTTNVVTTSNPNPVPNLNLDTANPDPNPTDNAVNDILSDGCNHSGNPCSEPELLQNGDLKEGEEGKQEDEDEGEVKGEKSLEGEESLRKLMEKTDALVEENNEDKQRLP